MLGFEFFQITNVELIREQQLQDDFELSPNSFQEMLLLQSHLLMDAQVHTTLFFFIYCKVELKKKGFEII